MNRRSTRHHHRELDAIGGPKKHAADPVEPASKPSHVRVRSAQRRIDGDSSRRAAIVIIVGLCCLVTAYVIVHAIATAAGAP